MKRILLSAITFMFSLTVFGQFASYKSNDDNRLAKLKECEMLVIGVDNPTAPKWVQFQEKASKYWSLTPVKIMKYMEAKRFSNKAKIATLQYSIETDGAHDKVGFTMSKGPGGIGSSNPTKNAKTTPLLNIFIYGKSVKGGSDYLPLFSQVIDNSARPNLSVYTLICFLRLAQEQLTNKEKDLNFIDNGSIIKKENLAVLKTTELIIPDDELVHFPPKKPKAEIKKEYETLTAAYTNSHRVVSVETADSLILNDAPVAIFCYSRYNSEKYVYVFDNSTGELLYKDHSLFTYPIKDTDFADLNKAVSKLKK